MNEVIKELEDLFATEAKGNVVYFNDVTNNTPIPRPVVEAVEAIADEHPDVIVKIGMYSVKVMDKEPIKSSINSSKTKMGKLHDDFVMGKITKGNLKKSLKDDGMDDSEIDNILTKWDTEVIKSAITYDVYKDGKFINTTEDFFEAENFKSMGYEVRAIKSSQKPIMSFKKAADCFPVSLEDAEDIDDLRATFPDKADLRAVLEDYFHIYDDYADMSAQDFDRYFEDYTSQPIESAFFAGNEGEVILEIKDGDKWEFVSLDNTPEGWSTKRDAKVFPSEERARTSTLFKRLNEAGYSEDKGNLRISKR